MIAALALKLGLSTRVVTVAIIALVVLAVAGAFYAALDAYGDSQFEAGEAHSDKAWVEASNKLILKASDAETKADASATIRVAEQAVETAIEKEKIDEALAHGTSPLDVLFPAE